MAAKCDVDVEDLLGKVNDVLSPLGLLVDANLVLACFGSRKKSSSVSTMSCKGGAGKSHYELECAGQRRKLHEKRAALQLQAE